VRKEGGGMNREGKLFKGPNGYWTPEKVRGDSDQFHGKLRRERGVFSYTRREGQSLTRGKEVKGNQ